MKIIKALSDFTRPGITIEQGHTRLVEDELAESLKNEGLVEFGDDPHEPGIPRTGIKAKAKKAAAVPAGKPG